MSFTPDWREGRKYESSVSPISRSYRVVDVVLAATFSSWLLTSANVNDWSNSPSVAESGGERGRGGWMWGWVARVVVGARVVEEASLEGDVVSTNVFSTHVK